MQQQRPTHEVKVFLHMNLLHELIKHVKRNNCLCHFDGRKSVNDTIHVIVDYRVDICPFNVYKCDATDSFKAIVDLPVKMKGNLKRTTGNSSTPLGARTRISALLPGSY